MAAEVIVYIEIFLDIWVKSGDLIDFIRGHAAYIEFQIIGKTVPVGIIFPIFFIVRVIRLHTIKFPDIINYVILNSSLLFHHDRKDIPERGFISILVLYRNFDKGRAAYLSVSGSVQFGEPIRYG